MTYGTVLLILWGLLLAASLGWALLGAQSAPEPVPATDPYDAEVAEFRREMHDWDR